MTRINKKKEFPHYDMCESCAEKMGGYLPKNGNWITVRLGTCQYCNKESQTLIPWVDFNWKDKRKDAIAKVSRD